MVCVWTSTDTGGTPTISFAPKTPAFLLGAWHIPNRRDLAKLHLMIRWDIYRGYHRDVSLLPIAKDYVTYRQVTVQSTLKAGTFKLSSSPRVDGLKKGWYSLIAQVQFTGKSCPSSNCKSKLRQTRFYMH